MPFIAAAQPSDIAARLGPDIDRQIAASYAEFDSLYKDIHAHPELALEEVNTAKKLATAMRALGFDVTEGVAKTGVVAMMRNGPGPTVMVRTELDALPMEEKTGLPYASRVKTIYAGKESFVAHSCGHDIHMAAWIGTAKTLVAMKDRWHGTLMFIAQPAEETLSGAKPMLAEGLFARFGKPDVAFALHTWPMAYGEVGLNSGPILSGGEIFEARFLGRGAHGSAPDKSIDPVLIASRFVVDVQGVISREKDPFQFGVFSIGAIQGGTAPNIIPDSVELRGTIRTLDKTVRTKLHDGIRRTAKATALMAGAPEPEVKIIPGVDSVVNDVAVVDRTETIFKSAFGSAKVKRMPPATPSDDFAEFVSAGVPSMFFFIGVLDPKDVEASRQPGGKPLPSNHSPFFAPVPEPSIKTGIKAMSLAVMGTMQ
ncbi:amidohydrolase [Variovorax sp. J22R24]|uniref:amidohydrolase n=1 Tax=Variovorax gracilis TaxID=3053502 RepID=UPI002577051F|nr:amidohydrolase [Variovorax sp. J22R24]MDM0109190.1 amidohydrolase [Variovorax sp. J22R24]